MILDDIASKAAARATLASTAATSPTELAQRVVSTYLTELQASRSPGVGANRVLAVPPKTVEEFQAFISEHFKNDLMAAKLADDLGYSRSTVSRWIGRRTSPHPVIWPSIFQWVQNERGIGYPLYASEERPKSGSGESPKAGPLSVTVDGDQLVIRIGVEFLAHATQNDPNLQTYDEREGRFFSPEVTDDRAWALAVVKALEDEEEDGTTLVHRALDKAAVLAIEGGADGILTAEDVRDKWRAERDFPQDQEFNL